MPIYFYHVNEKYGAFSNFAAYGFTLDGSYWPTSEHYFQAAKFKDASYAKSIQNARTPRQAADLGRSREMPLRADWEHVKDDVMRRALIAKFSQNAEIRQLLLDTGDELLVEKTTTDYYWGCGTEGNGKNRLGKLLMEVRSMIRDAE